MIKNIKFISPSLHGILDYLVDITLIGVPVFFNFMEISNSAFWVSVGIGLSNFLYSLFTKYSRSVVKIIPLKMHLLFDFIVGLILLTSGFVLPIEGFVQLYFLTMGAGIILATAFTNTNEDI
jgi:hypothetical protein